ncbi:MAG: hypothetical protein AAF495_27745 [Pseudomonadota bacterium]
MKPLVGLILGMLVAGPALAAEVTLAPDAKALIEKHLGKGVLDKPVAGNPIANAETFFPFEEGNWTFRYISGDGKGETETHSFTKIVKDGSEETGRYAIGPDDFWFVRRDQDGNINVVTEQDAKEGVVIHYSPPQPLYVAGLEPGQVETRKIQVKVYDLSHPDHLKYEGELDLTLSYIGAYEITVPAGTYEAALINWNFEGEIGPASIKEDQFRFLVEGVGPIAAVEKKAISAFLLYHDDSKYGKVLVDGAK